MDDCCRGDHALLDREIEYEETAFVRALDADDPQRRAEGTKTSLRWCASTFGTHACRKQARSGSSYRRSSCGYGA